MSDDQIISKLQIAREKVLEQLSQVIVGQIDVIDELLISIFSRGHCLLEGVPGLAKTLLISTLSRTLNLKFSRIQFTPDLMPADITGIDIIEEDQDSGKRIHKFIDGPLFANMILADEINRTPPKTQSALLEAMQEHRVTVGRTRHVLPEPFFVLATQNPIEQEGTYPLPEAQQDRFMFKIFVNYPTFDEELEIVRKTTSLETDNIQPVLESNEITALQKIVRQVLVSEHVLRYTLSLVRQTRIDQKKGIPEIVQEYVAWGAGPRAVQYLILGGKARALLNGRTYVMCEDIQKLVKPILRHRLVMSFLAESENFTADMLIEKLIEVTPIREDELVRDPRFQSLFTS
ncbi:MAG: MoxR family ATPase [Planctomycetaceae bacterium]|jgi:MoxR-like ATPase|nr:MoxR family ATPase [Planctomycetaceae bacterium]